MELSPALRMRFSNDATYLASEVERIAEVHSKLVSRTELSTKLKEAGAQLAIVARQRSDIELVRCLGLLEVQSNLLILPLLTRNVRRTKYSLCYGKRTGSSIQGTMISTQSTSTLLIQW